jgi:hypothetical protein
MGNRQPVIKCPECENLKQKYTTKYLSSSTTELCIYPQTFLGIRIQPKPNIRTDKYLCSNGHIITKKTKSK